MSQPTQSPGAPAPGSPAAAPPQAPDVAKQIADLTDAVNRLVQAHQQPRQTVPASAPDTSFDVGGDIAGGAPLVPAVDYARLSPVQQIALGLRDAKPVGPAHPEVARVRHVPVSGADDDVTSPAGAD